MHSELCDVFLLIRVENDALASLLLLFMNDLYSFLSLTLMLATYFLLLCKLFDFALLFLCDKSTLLAIIFESTLLQFMQFIIIYSSFRFILS